ncbi:DNA methyltransferase [Leuconostoc mesenteroides]|uniref:DNA methyltransferase n=1 Tax=Leuconostoc mesenteroides TaxID=1245 RepID=UPI0035246C8B
MYLIKMYTKPGDVVLDNTMGSGSTGIAVVNVNRDFIGIELNKHYYEIAQIRMNRITNVKK